MFLLDFKNNPEYCSHNSLSNIMCLKTASSLCRYHSLLSKKYALQAGYARSAGCASCKKKQKKACGVDDSSLYYKEKTLKVGCQIHLGSVCVWGVCTGKITALTLLTCKITWKAPLMLFLICSRCQTEG